jgi:hypothetical protein
VTLQKADSETFDLIAPERSDRLALNADLETEAGSNQGFVKPLGNIGAALAVAPRFPQLESFAQAGKVEHDLLTLPEN